MAITRIGNPAIADVREPNFRNIVINGDMSIAQRATSVSSITGADYYTVDRWQIYMANSGTYTQSQSTDVPSGQGFAKSLKMDCTTAAASPIAGAQLYLRTKFEGQNLQYLKYGTSSAESMTLSFWVKCNKATTASIQLQDHDNSKMVTKSYTINSADTWEKKTITFNGNTSNSFTNDANLSLDVRWWLESGSDFTSGTPSGDWEANDNTKRNNNNLALSSSTSNEWYITGVQLEAGQVASDFEFLPHDVNLQRCERYFGKSYSQGTNPGTDTFTGTVISRNYSTSDKNQNTFLGSFKVNMRTVPTVTIYSKAGNSGKIVTGSTSINSGGTEQTVSSVTVTRTQITGIAALFTGNHFGQGHYTADAEL